MSSMLRQRRGRPSEDAGGGGPPIGIREFPPSPIRPGGPHAAEQDNDESEGGGGGGGGVVPSVIHGPPRDDSASDAESPSEDGGDDRRRGRSASAGGGRRDRRREGSRMMDRAEQESALEIGSLAAEAVADADAGGSSPPSVASASGGGSGSRIDGSRGAMAKEEVAKDEGRLRKILIRVVSGALMLGVFAGFLYMGHVYICALIALVEVFLFRELVKVRYNTFFHIIEDTIPFFRTTQWMWFAVAIFYTYSDFVVEVIKSNTALHYLLIYAQLQTPLAFVLYSATFVLTIATMQTGHIRFQLNQLCWTIVVLCLTVGQLKYIMHNVYNGLIWFALPLTLVIINDIFAYFSGMTCGRKFIHRPFIKLSPNKTWEGFIGGWLFTMILGWYLSGFMAQYTWMTCPTNQFRLFPEPLECDLDPIFHRASSIFPPQIFEIFPAALVKMMPGVVDVCSAGGDQAVLTPCVSGEPTHSHHHFELVIKDVYPVQIHALSLSMFASLVAPFGGFLASAIKRAYGVKDFDSIIPGHGGMMDRMDCQFLMALCTWVHYNTFVKMATVSVPKMIYMYNLMKESEQVEFLERITELSVKGRP